MAGRCLPLVVDTPTTQKLTCCGCHMPENVPLVVQLNPRLSYVTCHSLSYLHIKQAIYIRYLLGWWVRTAFTRNVEPRITARFLHPNSTTKPSAVHPQGLARIARAEKSYQARLRKAFGGCFASGKLKGFASDGREVTESARRGDEQENFDGAPTAEDGPWSDGSESETLSGDESDRESGSDGSVSSEGDGREEGPVEESVSMSAGLEEPQMAAAVESEPNEEAEGGSAPASEPTRRSSSPSTDGGKDEFVIVEAPSSSSSSEEISKEPKSDSAIVEEGDCAERGEDRAGIMPPPPPHPEDDKQTKLKEDHVSDVAQGEAESAVGA